MRKILAGFNIFLTITLLILTALFLTTHLRFNYGIWLYFLLWFIDFLLLFILLDKISAKRLLRILAVFGAVASVALFAFSLGGLVINKVLGQRRTEYASPDKKHTIVIIETENFFGTHTIVYKRRFGIFIEELPDGESGRYASDSSYTHSFRSITFEEDRFFVEYSDDDVIIYKLK